MILDGELCEKKEESNDRGGWEVTENRGTFANKLVMIIPAQNYDFWWLDRSVSYLSNAF